MRLRFTERADKDYADLPVNICKAFGKQLRFLLANLRHPSSHAKKCSEAEEHRAGTSDARMALLLQDQGDEYIVLSIIPHH